MNAIDVKSTTKEQHLKVEKLLSKKLFSSDLLPVNYYELLQAFYFAYQDFENQIYSFSLTKDFLIHRSKLIFLEKDLSHLRSDFDIPHHFKIPQESLIMQNAEEALGVLYVTEGATLGGKIILENLKSHDWMNTEKYGNFFNSYGVARREMWLEFNNFIEDYFKRKSFAVSCYEKGANKAFNHIYNTIKNV